MLKLSIDPKIVDKCHELSEDITSRVARSRL